MPETQQHVAVLTFPFGSHGFTIFNLMLKLSRTAPNILFTFLSTKTYNEKFSLASKLPGLSYNNNVRFYDVDDGLPFSEYHPNHLLEVVELFIKKTPHNFQKAIDTAVAETGWKITCLITDAFLTFAAEMAETMQVPWIPVFVAMPFNVSAHINTHRIHQLYSINNDNTLDRDQTLDKIPGLSMIRVSDLSDEILAGDSGKSFFASMLSVSGTVLPKARAIVINFFQELYSVPLLDDLKALFPNLLNVGFLTQPLPPPPMPPPESDITGCLPWLDRQKANSVAYISFGTVATPGGDELIALAEALEETKTPFLWSLSLKDENLKSNPIISKISSMEYGHGKIINVRAPQIHILRHSSVGAFVTHGGANSVAESIANGVPMICRPFFGDHRMNARVVEEVWEIGLNVEGFLFTKRGMIGCLEIIFGDEKGKKMRENVAALREIVLNAAGPSGIAARDFKSLVDLI